MEFQDSAPALTRGVAILEHLSLAGWDSLDGVTRALDFPKSSTLRLLEALCSLNLVERSEAKTYRCLKHLVPMQAGDENMDAILMAEMKRLVSTTGQTIEWYLPSQTGMTVIRQLRAESEVGVMARVGYIRHWGTELDAVALLGYAYAAEAPVKRSGLHAYSSNGHRSRLSAAAVRERIKNLGQSRSAADPFFNENGVRRLAMAVCNTEGILSSVLSVATLHRFGHEPPDDFIFNELDQSVSRLI